MYACIYIYIYIYIYINTFCTNCSRKQNYCDLNQNLSVISPFDCLSPSLPSSVWANQYLLLSVPPPLFFSGWIWTHCSALELSLLSFSLRQNRVWQFCCRYVTCCAALYNTLLKGALHAAHYICPAASGDGKPDEGKSRRKINHIHLICLLIQNSKWCESGCGFMIQHEQTVWAFEPLESKSCISNESYLDAKVK